MHLVGPCRLVSEVKVSEWILLEEKVAVLDIWEGTFLFDDCIGRSVELGDVVGPLPVTDRVFAHFLFWLEYMVTADCHIDYDVFFVVDNIKALVDSR